MLWEFFAFPPGQITPRGSSEKIRNPPGVLYFRPGACLFTKKKKSHPKGENKATYGISQRSDGPYVEQNLCQWLGRRQAVFINT